MWDGNRQEPGPTKHAANLNTLKIAVEAGLSVACSVDVSISMFSFHRFPDTEEWMDGSLWRRLDEASQTLDLPQSLNFECLFDFQGHSLLRYHQSIIRLVAR
jgi:hypothetical protein